MPSGLGHSPQRIRGLCAAIAAFAAVATAQDGAQWFVRGSDAGMRIVGASTEVVRESVPGPFTTPPGEFAVHFARDAAGKPDSLALLVPAGARVRVAVEPAGAAVPISVEGPGVEAPANDPAQNTNYLVAATAVTTDSGGRIGLVARKLDADNWYRFVWDRERGQFRLERAIGGAIIVINAAPAPAGDNEPHELALQVQGFRLRAFFDDALVLQALDGAHERGTWGTWQTNGTQVQWRGAVTESPAAPRSSSALVQLRDSAVFAAATGAAAGHYYVIELALDRPHPLVPLTEAGLEPWLLQRPAAPRIVLGQFCDALGHDSIGELPVDGRMQCGLRWPVGAVLAKQAALVRALVVSPDGDRLVGRTPSVPMQM